MNEENFKRGQQTLKVRLLKAGHSNYTVFVLGSTGSGKTTLIANLVDEHKRWILFDTRNEYNPEFFGGEILEVSDALGLCDALNDGGLKIIVKLPTDREQESIMESCLACIYQFQSANKDNEELPPVLVVVDELNRFADTNDWPDSLREMIQRGRDFKIDKLLGAQWFNTIPTWCRDSFSEMYVFRHNDKNGLNMLENFGFEKEEIKNLPAYYCLHADKNGIERIRLAAANDNSANKKSRTKEK